MEENALKKDLVACIGCGEVASMAFARYPEYALRKDGEPIEIPRDDFAEFLRRHNGHRLGHFDILSGPFSEQPFSEPVKTEYFKVMVSGIGKRVLMRSRESINEPMKYQLVNGWLHLWVKEVDVETDAIRRQLMKEKPNLSRNQIDSFVMIVRDIITGREYPAEDDDNITTDRPLVFRQNMGDIELMCLDRNLRCLFAGKDLDSMREFVGQQKNAAEGGVLTAKVTIGLIIKQPRKHRTAESFAQ